MRPDPIQTIACPGLPPAETALPVVGNKAFNLLKLAAIGFPVPPGFVLPTSLCRQWIENGPPSPVDFQTLIAGPMERLEKATGLGFGDGKKPLVVSVRSGAVVSMPGMLDTVLDIGLTQATLPGLVAMTGNPRLAWDSYLRLIRSYAETVQGLDAKPFETLSRDTVAAAGVSGIALLDTLSLRDLTLRSLDLFTDLAGASFPDDPYQQLRGAVNAVFASWNSQKAVSYRRIKGLDALMGTAVTVQRMVYGNAGPNSGAGVGFTRNPATGEKQLYLDFAFDAQGEDVVSGRRPLTPATELGRLLPDVMEALAHAGGKLEQAFGDVQDFEFTVEEGQLFLLQTRNAKCSPWARLKIAVDLATEGLISPQDALHRLEGLDLASITRQCVTLGTNKAIASGVAAGIGVVSGPIAMTATAAQVMATQDKKPILLREDITTADIDAIAIAGGLLTMRGGRTSHAAVVAREMGKVAVVGCSALRLAADGIHCVIADRPFAEGEVLTLDGQTGQIYAGAVEVREERPLRELTAIKAWQKPADKPNYASQP